LRQTESKDLRFGLLISLEHLSKMNIMFAQAILQKESMRCGFVTGHDFSRAAKCLKIKVGFSPCGIFPIHNNRLFICTVPYAGASLIFIFRKCYSGQPSIATGSRVPVLLF
jgi:hypothetical protein